MTTENERRGLNLRMVAPLAVALAVVLAYAGSFSGAFVFDDYHAIEGNPDVRRLPDAMMHSTRPLVGLTIYLNYVLGGFRFNPADFHAFNLLVHIGAALLLYGIVRRTLCLPTLADRYGRYSTGLAAAVAAVWAVHPLQTESVTYIIQRAESMMGFFYLLTLYCFLRGALGEAGSGWHVAAILACACAMATKPVAATAPVMVLLFDRAFLGGSFRESFRLRARTYAGLAATWAVPACLLAFPHESSVSTGLRSSLISPFEYLMAQQGVVVHYLQLAFWPHSLCLDYAWPPATEAAQVLAPAALLLALLGLAVWGSARRHPAGFCGLWFFITLAPSSSLIPVADLCAEHRMYLALAGLAAVALPAIFHISRAVFRKAEGAGIAAGALLVTVLAVILGGLTIKRNVDYRSPAVMMRDVVEKRSGNFRAYTALSSALMVEGNYAEAEAVLRRMIERLEAGLKAGGPAERIGASSAEYFHPHAHNQLGRVLLKEGKAPEAIEHFRESLRAGPDQKIVHNNLAAALYAEGKVEDAEAEWNRALEIDPQYATPHSCLGFLAFQRGQYDKAASHYRRAVETARGDISIACEAAWFLATCPDEKARDGRKAVELATAVCDKTDWHSPRALDALAAGLAEIGKYEEACQMAQKALNLIRARVTEAAVAARGDEGETGSIAARDGAGDSFEKAIERRLELYRNGKPFRIETARREQNG